MGEYRYRLFLSSPLSLILSLSLTHTHTLSLSLSIYIYIYIVIHRQTVLFYHNSSMSLDTKDAWRWDGNPPNFPLE